MIQTPVNYYGTPVQQQQPSYNAVKIDIHNPKVTDGPQACMPAYPSAYGMPQAQYYNYPQANGMPCYPGMPQVNPYIPQAIAQPLPVCPMPQPVAVQPQVTNQIQQPQPVVVQPAIAVPQAQAVQQAAQPYVQPAPVPQVPVQQVINNGFPATQTITQNPVQPVVTPEPVQQPVQQPTVIQPAQTMQTADITPVLKGLQSNNMAEQSEALNKIGEAAENPAEIKKYLETSVLDSLLGILNTDTSGLEAPTPAQIEARTKMMNNKPLTDAEKNLAMTLAPQEVADRNKQHALYSISILQKALANEIEAKTGEKLTIEKLPAIDQVVNVVKENPNPLLRASALVALAHLDKPEYKPVLSEIFKLAQNDQDPNVKQVATEALNKIGAQV